MMNKFIYLFLFVFFSCTKHVSKEAGVCISFDDRSISEWYSLRTLFEKYHVKATFFITQPDSLSQEDIIHLKELELDGHEIAFHGNFHFMSEEYIKKHSYYEYWQNEIVSGMKKMKQLGFTCKTFAYPYGSKYWFTDFLLLRKFEKTRGICPLLKNQNIRDIDSYYFFDNDQTLSALSFDQENNVSIEKIEQGLSFAKDSNAVFLLYGHIPSKDSLPKGYSFSILKFEKILKKAQELELKFYTFKELN